MTHDAGRHAISEGRGCLSSVHEILEDMRNGRMVVLVDAEERENEGDLVIPAQMATPDAINFMARYGRGLICLTLTGARAAELELEAMVGRNRSRNRTAFTQSIEAREGISTGISAADRARTIATAIDADEGRRRHRLARPRVPARRARGRRADPRRPYRGFRRSGAPRRALPRGGHLRDHERRRHHGAHARPRRLRAAPRPEDRHHRGSDRLPAAQRPSRARHRQDDASRPPPAANSICTSTRRRSSRASIWRSSRATFPRPARCWCASTPSTCSAICSASARWAKGRSPTRCA